MKVADFLKEYRSYGYERDGVTKAQYFEMLEPKQQKELAQDFKKNSKILNQPEIGAIISEFDRSNQKSRLVDNFDGGAAEYPSEKPVAAIPVAEPAVPAAVQPEEFRVDQIILDQDARPKIAQITDNGRPYLVNITDSAQMTSGALNRHAERVGLSQLPVLECKKKIDNTYETSQSSIGQLDRFITQMQRNNDSKLDAFVLPMVISNERSSSGHTVYMVVTKENGQYRSHLIDQSVEISQEEREAINQYTSDLSATITRVTGIGFNPPITPIIAGAFQAEGNVASCTEIGVPFIKAMAHPTEAKSRLNYLIETCQTTIMPLQALTRIRFDALKYSPDGIDAALDTSTSVASAVIAEPVSAIDMFAINLKLKHNTEIANMDLARDVTILPLDGQNINAMNQLQVEAAKKSLTLTAYAPGAYESIVAAAQAERDRLAEPRLAAIMSGLEVARLNNDASWVTNSIQALANENHHGNFKAAQQDVTPIIKDLILESLRSNQTNDAKLLISSLETIDARAIFGEIAYNKIRTGAQLSPTELNAIPGYVVKDEIKVKEVFSSHSPTRIDQFFPSQSSSPILFSPASSPVQVAAKQVLAPAPAALSPFGDVVQQPENLKEFLENWVSYVAAHPRDSDANLNRAWGSMTTNLDVGIQMELSGNDGQTAAIDHRNAAQYLASLEQINIQKSLRHSDLNYLAGTDDIYQLQQHLRLPENSSWVAPTSQDAIKTDLDTILTKKPDIDNIYIPYCIHENHWITIALKKDPEDKSKFKMTVYNSMGNLDDDNNNMLHLIEQTVGQGNVTLEQSPVLGETQMLRQIDDKTCGYYCLMNAVLDANNQHIEGANRYSSVMDKEVREYFTQLEQGVENLPSVGQYMSARVSARLASAITPLSVSVSSTKAHVIIDSASKLNANERMTDAVLKKDWRAIRAIDHNHLSDDINNQLALIDETRPLSEHAQQVLLTSLLDEQERIRAAKARSGVPSVMSESLQTAFKYESFNPSHQEISRLNVGSQENRQEIKNIIAELINTNKLKLVKQFVEGLDERLTTEIFGASLNQSLRSSQLEYSSALQNNILAHIQNPVAKAKPKMKVELGPELSEGAKEFRSIIENQSNGISNARIIIESAFSDKGLREALAKEVMINAIHNRNLRTIRAIDPNLMSEEVNIVVRGIQGQSLDQAEAASLFTAIAQERKAIGPAAVVRSPSPEVLGTDEATLKLVATLKKQHELQTGTFDTTDFKERQRREEKATLAFLEQDPEVRKQRITVKDAKKVIKGANVKQSSPPPKKKSWGQFLGLS